MKIISFHFLLITLCINLTFSKQFLSFASCQDHSFLPTKENVKIIGRYYQEVETLWLIYSGSAIEFYASGDYVDILFAGDENIYAEKDYRPRFGVFVNDILLIDSKVNDLEFSLKFKIPNDGENIPKIRVMLLSENQNGGVGIKKIKINSCSEDGKIICPTEKKKFSIEFIGDSITCAYGVDAPDQTYPFTTTTENFSKSYAYLASKILDVDYSVMALSGHGIVSGYSGGDKWEDGIISLYYEKVSRNQHYEGDWDFENNQHDLIFINLGTNDANYVNADRDNRKGEFVQEFANFLQTVRKHYPDAYILCTLGTLNPKDMYPLVEEGVKLFGDEKISIFESPVQDMNDGLGADWHPSKITHEKLAKLVAEKISEILK